MLLFFSKAIFTFSIILCPFPPFLLLFPILKTFLHPSPPLFQRGKENYVYPFNKSDEIYLFLMFLKNLMAPFYGWGSTASRLEPFRRGSLLFTTKFPVIPGTHLIDLGRMKG